MRVNLAALCLAAFAGAGVCYGQTAPAPAVTTLQPGYSTVYCSGFVKDTKLPEDIRVISGEQPGYKVIFAQRENVYINRGSDNGVRIGDRFLVVRQTEDPDRIEWFKGQTKIAKAMGILYSDIGQLRVVSVESKTSVAEVVFSCEYMLRGDIVRPFCAGQRKAGGDGGDLVDIPGRPSARNHHVRKPGCRTGRENWRLPTPFPLSRQRY